VYLSQIASSRIGIVPLLSSAINEGKSNIRWLDYTAVGLATLASDVGEYATLGARGLVELVDTEAQWDEAISVVVDDPMRQREIVEASRETILAEYTESNLLVNLTAMARDFSSGVT
jgi:hypothetical protein